MSRVTTSSLRNLLLDNIMLKVSALFLAVVLWLHATNQQIYDQVLSIPLYIRGVPDSLIVVSPIPRKARVTFRAKGDQILWLSLRKPKVVLGIDDATAGVSTVDVHERAVDIPTGIDILGVDIVSPRQLRVRLDDLKRKTLPILVRTSGLPAPGYVRMGDELTINPKFVSVEGPAGVIDDLDRIHADPLDISGAKGSVSRELDLRMPDSPYLEVSAKSVRAEVRIEKLLRKTIHVPPSPDSMLPAGWVLEPSSLAVHLLVPESFEDSLDRVGKAGLLATVDVPDIPADSMRLAVSFIPPEWTQQCIVSPDHVLMRTTTVPPDDSLKTSGENGTTQD